jgi:general secretion pathway protein M
MMAWWQAREPRERLALLLAAVFVLASLFYYLGWQPLDRAYDRQLARQQTQTETLAWMRQAALEVKALGGQKARPPSTRRSLLAEAERAAAGNGMKASLKQLNPEGEDKLRVTVQDAEFDAFIRWLGRLDSAGVDISSLNLTRQDGGSRVQARLLLERRS